MERVVDLISQRDHPQRRALTEEMHLRHLPRFAAPTRLLQLVIYTPGTPSESSWRHAGALLDHYELPAPLPGKYFRVQLGELAFAWEQHSEVATYTFVLPGSFDDPFAEPLLQRLPADWVAALPGQVLRATQVALLASMDQRALLQLGLQQAVEGLSVIAISYYAVGILGYCFKALNHVWPGLDSGLASGIAAPLVVLVTWLLMRRLHKRIEAP